tara:strand:+ start:4970 stop:5566 length:597 start_codon:yes stop_codon:yes gene_type:complete
MTAKIDIINSMLATTGTLKLSSADSAHPAYIEADLILTNELETFNSMELWFNTSKRELQPDVDGRIVVPSDALWVNPTNQENISIRGQYLWDHDENTDIINKTIYCTIAIAVPIEHMPPAASQYIRALARYTYFLDQDGDARKAQHYMTAMQRAEYNLYNMNTKLSGLNFFKGPGFANFATRRYPSNANGAGGNIKIR